MSSIPKPVAAEIEIHPTLASGPGGQNVNKTASAAHLRYDVHTATLPEAVRTRLLAMSDHRIGADGVIVIKARQFRSFDRNRATAIERLERLIAAAATPPKPRKRTRPTAASKRRRLDEKTRRGQLKATRGHDPRDA
ncbi:MAG: aminoacyl-tRNA hydrolase [Nevskiaceae bacterium]|nr:MAG: aminoacyl-tRNA hydrolase [Nevskiaceae bacterium]TBR71987.1 MAG: aminoacyl-tRNA hydrolase [Nevskiaceae bacterium]